MTLDETIFNWLQIKYVAEQRKEDEAAQDTYRFFSNILFEEFKVNNINVTEDEGMYNVEYISEGNSHTKSYSASNVHQLFIDISNEPKYQ